MKKIINGSNTMGHSKAGGEEVYAKSDKHVIKLIPITDSKEGLHTQGEWYWYDSNKGVYDLGQWIEFELATKFSNKPLDTASIGKISFTGLGGRDKDDYEKAKANAELIVKAVNEHEKLKSDINKMDESFAKITTLQQAYFKENQKLKDERKALLEENRQLKGYQIYVSAKVYFKDENILTFNQWVIAGEPEE